MENSKGFMYPEFCLSGIIIHFRLLWIQVNHGKNKIQILKILAWGNDGVWRPTSIFFQRAYLFKRCQVEHILTMVYLELKPSPFMPRPNVYGQKIHFQLCLRIHNKGNIVMMAPDTLWHIFYNTHHSYKIFKNNDNNNN